MSLGGKRWLCPSPAEKAGELARELDIQPAVAKVLINRGIVDVVSARAFLNPSLEQLHSPWLMSGMESCIQRICRALQGGEKIAVYGDYDADGICATAILVEVLERLGGYVDYYLPSRFNSGYGLHREALAELKESGASLVITVDCGINAVAEAAYARQLNLDLIVTDHHQPLADQPQAVAVLNPLQQGCRYPFKELAGAGVAFKLATALCERTGIGFPADLLDLAALGTVADVVPLQGENRVIAAAGLEEISRLRRPGLKALAEATSLKEGQINSYTVAFVLAPSINAPGRMGEAAPAVRLLLERNLKEAQALAEQLHRENCLRRDLEQELLREAEAALQADPETAGGRIITLAGEGWHRGLAGIVASRLVERYYRPVVLIALEGEKGRGSARSIPGFDITAALEACSGHLERFGGHEQAAGLTVAASQVGALRRSLNDYAGKHMREEDLLPALALEGELAEEEISLELARELVRLQPFGTGNPAPLFLTRGWELKSWRPVGAGRSHLKLCLGGKNCVIQPVLFSGASLEPDLIPGRETELAIRLKDGFFRGEAVLDVELKDLRYSDGYRDGRLEVIDCRGRQNRANRLKKLLQGLPAAAVFAATQQRRAGLEKLLPPGAKVIFLTSGGGNGGFPAGGAPPDLVLYDLPLHEDLLEIYFQNCPPEGAVRIYLLYHESDRALNTALLDLSLPGAAALEQIYRSLAESAAAGGPADPEQAAGCFAVRPGQSFWDRCRAIFSESGLLKPDCLSREPGAITVETLHQMLERSGAYREARELREKCSRFQKMLLEAPPDQLAAYLGRRLA